MTHNGDLQSQYTSDNDGELKHIGQVYLLNQECKCHFSNLISNQYVHTHDSDNNKSNHISIYPITKNPVK